MSYESGMVWTVNPEIYFFHPVTYLDRGRFFTVNIQDGAERNVSAYLLLKPQFQVL